MVNDIAVQDFVNAIKEQPADTNTTYNATVSRVDNEGVVWVNIHGSEKETPTASTSTEVKRGDAVTVNWRNNKLYIGGNYSNPSAGVIAVNRVENVANNAQNTADVAYIAATNAVADAERAASAATSAEASASEAAISASNAETSAGQAATSAQNAQASAGTAATAATNAESSASTAATAATNAQASASQAATDAASARASAHNASEYASRALGNLSTVQSVAETLTWITQHGTMAKTTDTDLDPTHVYFVRDNNGDYVVGSYHYSIVVEPQKSALSTYYELTIDESLNNYVGTHLALTNEGLWLLPASSGTHKVLIATGAGSTYTTAGTYIIDSTGGTVASFRADGATIGESLSGKSRTEIDADGMQIIRNDSGTDIELANIGYGLGNSGSGTAIAPYYTFGERTTGSAVGNYSVAEGVGTIASGYASHAEGTFFYDEQDQKITTTASSTAAHAEGSGTTASGVDSHAEGFGTIASDRATHAEGMRTVASGDCSHAEGYGTTASGVDSHAEGHSTEASGSFAHAEGYETHASDFCAHAQNRGTIASSSNQTAIGKYNVEDALDNYALIVGNGSDDNQRSNALTVSWAGAIDAAGDINIASNKHFKINGTNLSASDVSAVALSDKYTRSSAGDLGWTSTADGDAKVIAKSALAFWNGAYSGNSSNLSKCSSGNIIGSSGGTMTGRLLTSFNSSVAMGSYGSSQQTVDGLVDEIRYSSGAAGSASINTAYTKSGVTIATGWYNYFYMPHRSGGNSGAADGDNVQYGNLFLFGMNNTNGRYVVRVSSGAIQEVAKLITTVEEKDYITERGKSGDWYYEKWNSGKVEAWGSATFTGITYSASGNLYRATGQTASIPSSIFSSTPTFADGIVQSSSTVIVNLLVEPVSSTSLKWQMWKTTSGSNDPSIQFHAIYYPSTY